jgi:Phosphoserine phosphatase RsbU, N-terminal domain
MSYTDLFFRRYRAALLEYLFGDPESGLAYAYEFGRARIDERVGILQIVRVHQKALKSILESVPMVDHPSRLIEAEEFLMEALSTFEMASRGYVAMVHTQRDDSR